MKKNLLALACITVQLMSYANNKDILNCSSNLRLWDFQTIKSAFSELEATKIDHNTANKILRDKYVDSLLPKWNCTNVDSLDLLLNIVEKYQSYAETSPELANFFGEVADNYGMYVADKLTELSNNDKEAKSTFRFNYVAQHSRCLMYAPNISLDNSEKVIKNLSEGNLSYLWNRFWNGTSFVFKSLIFLPVFLLLTIFFYGFFLIIKKHLKTKTK